MRTLTLLACLGLTSLAAPVTAARAQDTATITRADTLRGSIGPQRAWWDVTFYDLNVAVQPADSSIRGRVGITYRVVAPHQEMQIDLKQPLVVDSMLQRGRRAHVPTRRRRVLRHARRAATRRRAQQRRRVLPRSAARRAACAVGWWIRVGARQPGRTMGRNGDPGLRRERLVAEQGHPGRRARQPARGDHRSGHHDERLERTAASYDEQRGRHADVRVVREEPDQQLRRRHQRRQLRALQRQLRRRVRPADARLLAARVQPREGEATVHAGEADPHLLRAVVRTVPLVRGRFQARGDTTPRHGAPECRRIWKPLSQRVPRPGSLGHRRGAQVGLHHRARGRARVVGQQHHDPRHRGHVGARELRELCGEHLLRVSAGQSGGCGLRDRHAQGHRQRRPRSSGPSASIAKVRATCTPRAATCCTPSARS